MRWTSNSTRATRVAGAAAIGLALALWLASCTHPSGASLDQRSRAVVRDLGHQARRAGATEQADVLADGKVTDVEYRKVFSLFSECMAREGAPITDPVISPIDGHELLWTLEDLAAPGKVINHATAACQMRYIGYVSGMAVAEFPKPMDVRLRGAVVACRKAQGSVVPATARDLRQILRAVAAHSTPSANDQMKESSCIDEGITKLFPDLPGHGFVAPSQY